MLFLDALVTYPTWRAPPPYLSLHQQGGRPLELPFRPTRRHTQRPRPGNGAVCAQPAPRAVGLFGQPPAVRGMPTLQAARQGGLPASTIPHPPSSYGPPPHGAAQVVSWDRGTAGGLPPPRGHRHRRWGRVTPAEGAGNSPRAAVINRAPPPPPQASGVGEWTALPCP